MGAIRVFHAHQRDTWSLDFVLSTGKRVAVERLPVGFTFGTIAAQTEVEVEGQKTITRVLGPGLRTLGFSTVVGNTKGRDSDCESQLARLLAIPANGWQFRISGAASTLETTGWWRVVSCSVNVTHRNSKNRAARAVLEWDLVEQVDDRVAIAPTRVRATAKKSTTSKKKPAKAATTRKYTVRAGDYPWKIAKNLLGDGQRWKEIYNLNRSVIPNVNDIRIGTVLKVPVK